MALLALLTSSIRPSRSAASPTYYAHLLLLTAHCSLLTAHCPLPTAHCPPLTSYYLLLTSPRAGVPHPARVLCAPARGCNQLCGLVDRGAAAAAGTAAHYVPYYHTTIGRTTVLPCGYYPHYTAVLAPLSYYRRLATYYARATTGSALLTTHELATAAARDSGGHRARPTASGATGG